MSGFNANVPARKPRIPLRGLAGTVSSAATGVGAASAMGVASLAAAMDGSLEETDANCGSRG